MGSWRSRLVWLISLTSLVCCSEHRSSCTFGTCRVSPPCETACARSGWSSSWRLSRRTRRCRYGPVRWAPSVSEGQIKRPVFPFVPRPITHHWSTFWTLNTLLDLDSAGLYRRQVDPGGKCEVLACPYRSPASSQATAATVTAAGEHTQTRVETWRLPETWKHKYRVEKIACLLKNSEVNFHTFPLVF